MPPSALSSFDHWFDAYAPSLVLYARQWLDGSAAENAVQEVFIQLLQQRRALAVSQGLRYKLTFAN